MVNSPMNGLSSSTVIQTTWRSHLSLNGQSEVKVTFKSTTGSWVTFQLNAQSGIIHQIQGFTPRNQIPGWYTEFPFTEWSISFGPSHWVKLHGNTVHRHQWTSHHSQLEEFVQVFSAQTICALWLGKYGYTILNN